MDKTISRIFEEANVRITPNILNNVKDGRKYKRGKTLASNGKLADCIIFENEANEIDAVIEFLRNYIKAGDLNRITEIKLEEYIKKIRRKNRDCDYNIQEAMTIDNLENKNDTIEVEHDVIDVIEPEVNDNYIVKNEYSKLVELVASTETLWNSYSNLNAEKIFKVLYNNKYILGLLLEKMLE